MKPQLKVLKFEETPKAPRRKSRAKAVIVREDDGDGNWLVSYADLMTLLFGFFVMLSAFSTPDSSKFEQLKQATSKSLGTKYTKPYEALENEIRQLFEEVKLDKEIAITQDADGVKITSKGTLFFESGSADMREKAQEIMINLGSILSKKAEGFRVIVEGHTDDVPIATKQFPSNWELSSARAGSVVRLFETQGIASENLRPVGLAHTEPVLPNRTPTGEAIPHNQAENRRIVIQIQKQISGSSRKGAGVK